DPAFGRITGGEFRKPDGAARTAGVRLWREFFLHLPGSDETGGAAIALRGHCGIRSAVVFAGDFDFHTHGAKGDAGRVSAVLSTGHPEHCGLDEGKCIDDERRTVGRRVVWPASMRWADVKRAG